MWKLYTIVPEIFDYFNYKEGEEYLQQPDGIPPHILNECVLVSIGYDSLYTKMSLIGILRKYSRIINDLPLNNAVRAESRNIFVLFLYLFNKYWDKDQRGFDFKGSKKVVWKNRGLDETPPNFLDRDQANQLAQLLRALHHITGDFGFDKEQPERFAIKIKGKKPLVIEDPSILKWLAKSITIAANNIQIRDSLGTAGPTIALSMELAKPRPLIKGEIMPKVAYEEQYHQLLEILTNFDPNKSPYEARYNSICIILLQVDTYLKFFCSQSLKENAKPTLNFYLGLLKIFRISLGDYDNNPVRAPKNLAKLLNEYVNRHSINGDKKS